MENEVTLDIKSTQVCDNYAKADWQSITQGTGAWPSDSKLRPSLVGYLRDAGEHEAASAVEIASQVGGVIEVEGWAYCFEPNEVK